MLKPIKTHKGIIATLNRSNVDTDQIIPKQFLKSIARTGFGEHLFFDWRYKPDGSINQDFELNKSEFQGSSILVTRNNFGCGSSREHAVWALHQDGFQVIVAPWRKHDDSKIPAFADIFRNNCAKNGVLTIELSEAEIEEIFQMVARYQGLEGTADVDEQRFTLHVPEEISFHFDIEPEVKKRLIHGLDDIKITLELQEDITAFEEKHNSQLSKK